MTNRETVGPEALVGQTIASVAVETYDEPGSLAEIVLALEDGRRFEFSSCSCCGGCSFNELVEDARDG